MAGGQEGWEVGRGRAGHKDRGGKGQRRERERETVRCSGEDKEVETGNRGDKQQRQEKCQGGGVEWNERTDKRGEERRDWTAGGERGGQKDRVRKH